MVAPMVVLAAITAVVGFGSPAFAEFLGHEGVWPDPLLASASTGVALLGIAAGWLVYARKVISTEAIKERTGYVYDALVQKLYFDLTYEAAVIKPFMRSADGLAWLDSRVIDGVVDGVGATWRGLSAASSTFDTHVVDGAVNGVATLVRAAGERLRGLQVGRVQTYQSLVVGGL
jgi:NADH-quinone oxidoreductase subunit L